MSGAINASDEEKVITRGKKRREILYSFFIPLDENQRNIQILPRNLIDIIEAYAAITGPKLSFLDLQQHKSQIDHAEITDDLESRPKKFKIEVHYINGKKQTLNRVDVGQFFSEVWDFLLIKEKMCYWNDYQSYWQDIDASHDFLPYPYIMPRFAQPPLSPPAQLLLATTTVSAVSSSSLSFTSRDSSSSVETRDNKAMAEQKTNNSQSNSSSAQLLATIRASIFVVGLNTTSASSSLVKVQDVHPVPRVKPLNLQVFHASFDNVGKGENTNTPRHRR